MAIQPTRQEADSTGTLSQYAHLYDVDDEAMEREKADSQLSDEIAREVSERKEADEEIKGMIVPTDLSNYVNFDRLVIPLYKTLNNKLELRHGRTLASVSNYLNVSSVSLSAGPVDTILGMVDVVYNKTDGVIHGARLVGNDSSQGDTVLMVPVSSESNYGVVKPSDSILSEDGIIKLNPGVFSDGLTATDAQVSLDMGFVGEHLAGDGLYYDSTDGLQVKVGDGLEVQNDQICIDQDKLPFASTNGSNRGVARYDPNREIHINEDGYVTVQSATKTRRGVVKAGSGLNVATDGTLSVDTSASSGTEIIEFNQTLDKTGFTCTGYFIGYLREEATQGGTSTLFTPIKASLLIQLTAAFASGTSIDIPDLGEFSYQASVEDVYQVNAGYGTGHYVMSIEGNYTGSVDTNLRKIYLYSSLPSGTVIDLVI